MDDKACVKQDRRKVNEIDQKEPGRWKEDTDDGERQDDFWGLDAMFSACRKHTCSMTN